MKYTTIVVHHERWKVPWGFGALYLERVKDENRALAQGRPGEVLGDLAAALSLVGYEAAPSVISEWPKRRRIEAFVWAVREHLVASDNPLKRHPPLDWLPEPWRGPAHGTGIFYGPSPTVLS